MNLSDELTIDWCGSYLCLCSTFGDNVVSFGKISSTISIHIGNSEKLDFMQFGNLQVLFSHNDIWCHGLLGLLSRSSN